jgi:hypothetical protein
VKIGVVVVLLAGCGGTAQTAEPTPEPTPEAFTIDGTFTLYADEDSIITQTGEGGPNVIACAGSGGYDDIEAGLGVVVRNEDGTTIGTGELTQEGLDDPGSETECTFAFSIDVPEAEFYSIEVGSRGELTYSAAEMEDQGWRVSFELGR